LRIAQALIIKENDGGLLGTVKLPAKSSYMHVLRKARISLQRALRLEGLEAETRTEGQLDLAKVAFLLGEIDEAQQQAVQVMTEAQRYEQTWLLACAQRLMGSILSAVGQREQANEYFEQAIETFHHSGMRLEWARTLQNYGLSLLEEYRKGDTGYEQGLKNLQDARQSLRECHATFDLQGVERILTRYTAPAVPSDRKITKQAR
jgi:tetratricopeptide (TPR) repeat protein